MISQLALFAVFTIFTVALSQNATTYTYKTVDDINITLDVYLPTQSPYTKYPVFFTIHGGGYVESSKNDGLSPLEKQEVLSLGFAYITIDYRLIPGVLLPDVVEDCQDAYNFVRNVLANEININVDAMIVAGRSAGGGLSLIGGYTFEPRPKALIVFYPGCANYTEPSVYNSSRPVSPVIYEGSKLLSKPILTEYVAPGSVDPRWALFWAAFEANQTGWLFVARDPKEPVEQVMATLKNYSAVYHVDKDYPPTYFVHGLEDGLVPYYQSVSMAGVLNATGIPYVLDLVPGVNHAFDEAITDPNSTIYQQYIIPAFNFAVSMVQGEVEMVTDIISV